MFMKNIHGGDIYKYENVTDFSANINPMGIPESVREAVVNSLEMCKNYPQMFCDDLREKIGRRYGVDSSFIICGNGASDVDRKSTRLNSSHSTSSRMPSSA